MKIVLPFILLVFSFITKVYSQDIVQEDCFNDGHLPMGRHEIGGGFVHFFREQEWFATTPSLVEKAPCRKKRSNAEMISELSKLSKKGPFETVELRGIELKEQNKELIEAFVDLVSKRDVLGKLESDDEQPNLSVAKDCQNVICATQKIFGDSIGPKLLFMRQKFGMNGSDLAYSNSSRLKTNEIDSFIRSLDDLPKHMIPFVKNKKMTRFSRGYTLKAYGEDGGNVLANASMAFFDGWEDKKREGERDYVCTHEIGHVIAREFELDTTPEWLSLSDWEDLGDDWEAGKQENLVSNYARTNPSEDFAESVSAYRYNPKALKEIAPQKYEFIKDNVYAGIEYLDEKSCNKEAPLLAKLKEQALSLSDEDEEVLRDMFSDIEIHKKCSAEFNQELNDKNTENQLELDGCIINNFLRQVLNRSKKNQEVTLQEKSLLRHATRDFINSSMLFTDRSTVIEPARNVMTEQLKNGLVEALEASVMSVEKNALQARDCNAFEEALYDYRGTLDKRFEMNSFSYRVNDLFRDFGRSYCELHIKNHGQQRELDHLDLKYTAYHFFKDDLSPKKVQWQNIERLQASREDLLNMIKNRSAFDRAISWVLTDTASSLLLKIERELNRSLDEL